MINIGKTFLEAKQCVKINVYDQQQNIANLEHIVRRNTTMVNWDLWYQMCG